MALARRFCRRRCLGRRQSAAGSGPWSTRTCTRRRTPATGLLRFKVLSDNSMFSGVNGSQCTFSYFFD
jgi:hypothetical protein